jgi:energy-coupling factor transport system permease protein
MKRRAPVAKLGAALILPVMLLFSLDPLVPAIALAGELIAVPFFGLRYRDLWRRAWPLVAAAAAMMVTYTLFAGSRTGEVWWHLGPLAVTTGTLSTSAALALRLLAIALPGVIVFATTDPADLADSLIQHARVSPRFAIGALASFRLVGTLREEWTLISMARRARGLRKAFASQAFVLMVGAIRRGVRLSVAMDARGFDSGIPRSVARPQSFSYKDVALILGTVALGALALIAGQQAGS